MKCTVKKDMQNSGHLNFSRIITITALKMKQSELTAELQIRGCIEDNSKIIFLISKQNICCDPTKTFLMLGRNTCICFKEVKTVVPNYPWQ